MSFTFIETFFDEFIKEKCLFCFVCVELRSKHWICLISMARLLLCYLWVASNKHWLDDGMNSSFLFHINSLFWLFSILPWLWLRISFSSFWSVTMWDLKRYLHGFLGKTVWWNWVLLLVVQKTVSLVLRCCLEVMV